MTIDNETPAIDWNQIVFEDLPEEVKAELAKLANDQLRGHTKKVESENSALREQVMKTHLAEIGLNGETGLGKAIAKEYDGEYTVEAIAAYAKAEYNHEHESGSTPPEVARQAKVETMHQQSQPMVPEPQPTPAEQAAERMHNPEATREDAQRSLAGKVAAFSEQFYGPTGPTAPPDK